MNNAKKTALCGVTAAFATIIMLFAYFPYFTYAVPAAAGALLLIPCIEIGKKWAFGTYVATALVSLILCEKEAAVLYAGFFGYYLIIKALLEGLRINRFSEQCLKQVVFSVAVVLSYFVITYVFSIPFSENEKFGLVFAVGFLIVGNIVFAVYDLGLSRVISLYLYKYHERIQKMLK